MKKLIKNEIDEVFVPIKNYETRYLISNKGRVYSIIKSIILKPKIERNYYRVQLFNGKMYKHFFIHRLVATNFIPNRNNFLEVNHKDENKLHNCVDNLEWCTKKYNINYGTAIYRSANNRGKKIIQLDKNNNFINSYNSLMDAERITGISNGNINACCKGKRKTAGGYIWKYSL